MKLSNLLMAVVVVSSAGFGLSTDANAGQFSGGLNADWRLSGDDGYSLNMVHFDSSGVGRVHFNYETAETSKDEITLNRVDYSAYWVLGNYNPKKFGLFVGVGYHASKHELSLIGFEEDVSGVGGFVALEAPINRGWMEGSAVLNLKYEDEIFLDFRHVIKLTDSAGVAWGYDGKYDGALYLGLDARY